MVEDYRKLEEPLINLLEKVKLLKSFTNAHEFSMSKAVQQVGFTKTSYIPLSRCLESSHIIEIKGVKGGRCIRFNSSLNISGSELLNKLMSFVKAWNESNTRKISLGVCCSKSSPETSSNNSSKELGNDTPIESDFHYKSQSAKTVEGSVKKTYQVGEQVFVIYSEQVYQGTIIQVSLDIKSQCPNDITYKVFVKVPYKEMSGNNSFKMKYLEVEVTTKNVYPSFDLLVQSLRVKYEIASNNFKITGTSEVLERLH